MEVLGGPLLGWGTLGPGPWEGLEMEELGGVEKEALTKARPLDVYPSLVETSSGTYLKGDCDLSHVIVRTGGARAGKLIWWSGRLLLLGMAALLSAVLLDISMVESLSLRSVAWKTGVGDLFLLSCL